MRRTAAFLACALAAAAQNQYEPPKGYPVTDAEKRQVAARLEELKSALRGLNADPALFADVDVYRKAGEWILRYPEEFYAKAYVANAVTVLEHGIARAGELRAGKPAWTSQTGRLVRAYRSRVDGSVQPYALVIPPSYDGKRPVRLDVVLHGRGATLNEVSFITAHEGSAPVPASQDYIQLEVFGRTNNAYRWSGETDVFEALESVQKRYRIDPDRILLRGFSMGGAGTWHIGLHYPDLWAGIEAGAGFVETKTYAKQKDLPPWQERTLHIYDAMDYALNAHNVPTVGYGGEIDPQLAASVHVREQLEREGFHFRQEGLNRIAAELRALFLVGPQTPHRFHPGSKLISDEFLDKAAAEGRRVPDHIRFVTYTPRYNRCFWITVDALEKIYSRAEIDARRSGGKVTAATRNIARLTVREASEVELDGQRLQGGTFERRQGKWAPARGALSGKRHGLQGPIDDAFMEPFLCVRPSSGTSEALDRFAAEYAKYFRADLRIKSAGEVTAADIASSNLVLFGEPATNRLIARVAPKLPVKWAPGQIPALIYPNPLNPARYVVLNSGHTFHAAELRGTNALLFPRWGDYATVSRQDGALLSAGLFDEYWRFGSR